MKIKKHVRINDHFELEEISHIVYQILRDNKHVCYINLGPEEINYGVWESKEDK